MPPLYSHRPLVKTVLRSLVTAAIVVTWASILLAGVRNAVIVTRALLIKPSRYEEMRVEMVPAVAAVKHYTGQTAFAFIYDANDPTGRTIRELAFPSTVIFTSVDVIRADCLKRMRERHDIRYIVAVSPVVGTTCVAGWRRAAAPTRTTPALWVGQLR